MTHGARDGWAGAEIAARLRKHKGAKPDNPIKTLDALAVELGKIAAERDFAISAQDKSETNGLSSLAGRTP